MISLNLKSPALVKKILKKYLPGVEVKAFGSRVTGRAKTFSDLHLLIIGDKPIPIKTINTSKFEFSKSDLAILVDIVGWNAISEEFREKIAEDCVTLIAK